MQLGHRRRSSLQKRTDQVQSCLTYTQRAIEVGQQQQQQQRGQQQHQHHVNFELLQRKLKPSDFQQQKKSQ
eukprot:scaffold70155_cov18-Tisochrysis_lutea.AAC.1